MSKRKEFRAIVTGGGTAGHINPALSIAKRLIESGGEILYVGSGAPGSMDERIVTQSGLRFYGLDLTTPSLKFSFVTIKAVLKILAAVWHCRKIVRKEKPDFVIGTGGYVSMAMCLAAWTCGVPTFIEEQNIHPGITNRFLARFVKKIFLTFEESIKFFPAGARHKCIVTGLPLLHQPERIPMEIFEERNRSRFRILVFGGSNGAAYLNSSIAEILPQLAQLEGLELLLSTGVKNFDRWVESNDLSKHPQFEAVPYINDMTDQLEQASLVICRAGSSTVFEIVAAAVPAIVIPSPNVAGDHQRPNAEYLASTGGALLFDENKLPSYKLLEIIADLYHNKEKLSDMKRALTRLQAPKALDVIERELSTWIGSS